MRQLLTFMVAFDGESNIRPEIVRHAKLIPVGVQQTRGASKLKLLQRNGNGTTGAVRKVERGAVPFGKLVV